MLTPSTDELARMRDDVIDLLPDTGSILSVSETPDGSGGITQAWGTATAGVSYRLDPIRGREAVSGGALLPFHKLILTLPYDTTISAQDRFKAADGTEYNVVSVDDGKSWQVSIRCEVERI